MAPAAKKPVWMIFSRGGGSVEGLHNHASDALRSDTKEQARAAKMAADLERLKAEGAPIIETHSRQMKDTLRELSNALAAANANTPRLFHSSEGLAHITLDKDGAPSLQKVNREFLQSEAAAAARWISTSEREGVRNVAPPRDLCAAYLATSRLVAKRAANRWYRDSAHCGRQWRDLRTIGLQRRCQAVDCAYRRLRASRHNANAGQR